MSHPLGDRVRPTENGCLEFTGARCARGYGWVRHPEHRRPMYAHRASWEVANGPIPDGLFVLHSCDNRRCCNLEHLRLGTHRDNMDDRRKRGRTARNFGEENGRARFTAEQVREIRRRYSAGGVLQRELAEEYGTTQARISEIVRGATWGTV